MQKQIAYPSLIFRLLATMIDLTILSFVFQVISYLLPLLQVTSFESFLRNIIISTILPACYFILFWKYKSTTPGKMVIRAKIVDAKTMGKPSAMQLVGRFLSYSTFLFGIWSIPFTKKSQALHDKISGTLVISD